MSYNRTNKKGQTMSTKFTYVKGSKKDIRKLAKEMKPALSSLAKK